MKKTIPVLLICTLVLGFYGLAAAKEKRTIAVIPFALHSADNIDFIGQGVQRILSSRLGASEMIEVKSREATAAALKGFAGREFSVKDVEPFGKLLEVDYVVWGSLTKIGKSISIDANLSEIPATRPQTPFIAETQSLDEVILRTGEVAERIIQHITGAGPPQQARQEVKPPVTPARTPPIATPPVAPRTAPTASAREAEIISALRGGGKKATLTSTINPDFINQTGARGAGKRGFWMSSEFPNEFKGMSIGNMTGSDHREIVMIDSTNIFIYRKVGTELKLLHHLRGRLHDNYLSVDAADINGNGIDEIIVTNINQTLLNSFVMEFRDGKFVQIASDIRMFLRVINPNGREPILLGQPYGTDGIFNSPIHEIVWQNGRYQPGRRMRIPQGLPIYGLTLDSLGTGPEKVITLNEQDNIIIFRQTDLPLSRIVVFGGSREILHSSDDVFGGSSNALIPPQPSSSAQDRPNNTFLNVRILTYDIEGKGRREIILPRNNSPTGRFLANIRHFTSSEVFSLSWDGLGLAENWRTRRINGYVADYQIDDLNNDGRSEIILLLVRGQGIGRNANTVLVSYDIMVDS